MSLFATIDKSLRDRRRSFRLERAFERWRERHDCLTRFTDVDDLSDWWGGGELPSEPISDGTLAALCVESAPSSKEPGEEIGRGDEDAACLLFWLLIPSLEERTQNKDIAPALDREDVEAEMAAGVWEAVVATSSGDQRVATRLANAGRQAARRAGHRQISHERLCRDLPASPMPALEIDAFRYPEELIARALQDEVLNEVEADLIFSTRLSEESLLRAGWRHRLTARNAQQRRARAEARLRAWMAGRPIPSRFAAVGDSSTHSRTSGVLGPRKEDPTNTAARAGKEVVPISASSHLNRGPGAIQEEDEMGGAHASG